MKKKILIRILFAVFIILEVFFTLLSVYTTKQLIQEPNFRFDLFLLTIGSYALVIAGFIALFILILRMLGGDKNGKNS